MKVVALTGGVGGSKLVAGLARILPGFDLTVVVNTGDDFDHLGLRLCPDLDTVCYTLASLSNPTTGWGRKEESWNFLSEFKKLSDNTWFQIGDKDLATHIFRTEELKKGVPLHSVVQKLCDSWGIKQLVLPMSNQFIRTIINTIDYGKLSFQDYFVKFKYEPIVKGIEFEFDGTAIPSPGVLESIQEADAVIICPSNPWISIDPILNLPGIKSSIKSKPTIAISPIIQGKALKGPASKIFSEIGIEPSSIAVAHHYNGLIKAIVLDNQDVALLEKLGKQDIRTFTTNTIMNSIQDKVILAEDVLDFIERIIE